MSFQRFLIGIITLVLFLITPKAFSQPMAGFTYTFTNGSCEPDSVVFTNTSTGAVDYIWDFGDFSPADTSVNPSHWYFTGTFIVTLTAFDTIGNSDTHNEIITIEFTPWPGWAWYWADPNPACPGSSVEFNNFMFPSPSNVKWYFGDGDSSTSFNPSHTYPVTGIYQVTYIAYTACGSDTFIDTVWVSADAAPFASFGINPNPGCPGQNITFSNSSWPTPTSNLWYFGDGDSSTAFNPSHAYADTGDYTVTLIAYSDCSSDTISDTVKIRNSIIPSVSAGGNPNPVCSGDWVRFNGSGSYLTGFFWDFNDGNFSFLEDPNHPFADTGTYIVVFTGTNACGNSNSDTVLMVVDTTALTSVSFWWNPFGGICPNDPVNFEYWSSSPVNVLWDFGDGDSSTSPNPTHAYADTGIYIVRLIFENSCGIIDTDTNFISITNDAVPVAWFCIAPFCFFPNPVCPGTPVTFINGSSDTNNVFWDFGDGDTSILVNPSHIFADTGTYVVILRITNNCGNSAYWVETIIVTYNVNPVIWWSGVSPSNDCLGETFNFDVFSFSDPSNALWNFGDGDTATGEFVTHVYTAAGNYTVMVTLTNACGSDTDYVYVTVNAGPVADFTNTTICIGDTTFFTDASVGSPIQWQWDFGDGDTSTAQNPSHLYATPGFYAVSLTVSDSFCSNFITKPIIVGGFPIVNLGNDTTVCTSLLLNAKNAGGSYLWNTGETTKIIPVNTTGTYWVDVTSPVGCTTRDSINITMAGVKVNLNVFLEGAYTGGGSMSDSLYVLGYLDTLFLWGGIAPVNMDPGYPVPSDGGGNAVDVILIQIRTGPTTVLDTAYAWLMKDGTIRDFQTGQKNYAVLCGLVSGDYYVAVMHRNHLTIMYSDSLALDNTPPPPVDLTNVINIYGGGVGFLGDGPYGMWGANARNSDQEVNANDLYDVSVGRDVLLTGYNSSDVNLTGVVNANDFNIASYNNDQLYQSTAP